MEVQPPLKKESFRHIRLLRAKYSMTGRSRFYANVNC